MKTPIDRNDPNNCMRVSQAVGKLTGAPTMRGCMLCAMGSNCKWGFTRDNPPQPRMDKGQLVMPLPDDGHQPSEVGLPMADFVDMLKKRLNPDGRTDYVFALLVVKAGGASRINYASNGERDDMVEMMRTYVAGVDARKGG